jgi:methionine aminopeptidase
MTINSQAELAGLLRIGRLVGMTTADLDAIGERFLHRYGAGSAPKVTYRYPGTAAAVTHAPLNAIGKAVEREVQRHGFSVLSELPGHGVGRGLHEDPAVLRLKHKLHTGLVITIEPHTSAKPSCLLQDDDGWTLRTAVI